MLLFPCCALMHNQTTLFYKNKTHTDPQQPPSFCSTSFIRYSLFFSYPKQPVNLSIIMRTAQLALLLSNALLSISALTPINLPSPLLAVWRRNSSHHVLICVPTLTTVNLTKNSHFSFSSPVVAPR